MTEANNNELWLNRQRRLVYHERPVKPDVNLLPSSSGEDAALSRLKHEFDSRRERHCKFRADSTLPRLKP